MTKYRLKDQRVQKFLTDLLGKRDVDSIMERLVDGDLAAFCINVEFDDGEFVDSIDKSDVQLVHEYNPNGWNDFSEITPPKVGVYRVEVFSDSEHTEPCVRAAGYWDGKRWQVDDPQGGGYYYLMDGKIRFKSWE